MAETKEKKPVRTLKLRAEIESAASFFRDKMAGADVEVAEMARNLGDSLSFSLGPEAAQAAAVIEVKNRNKERMLVLDALMWVLGAEDAALPLAAEWVSRPEQDTGERIDPNRRSSSNRIARSSSGS